MNHLSTGNAEFNLQQVLLLMDDLVQWLIRSGVGYNDFSAALKSVFYQQAIHELERIEQKQTVSSISLLSGLHRKDVTAFKKALESGQTLTQASVSEPISVPSRVVGLWIAEGLEKQLPFSDKDQFSFEDLVRRVSVERHPRSVLSELERLNIVSENEGVVSLQQYSFVPDTAMHEARKILTRNVHSHLQAGLHNLFKPEEIPYLEQAVRADELTVESVQLLHEKSLILWKEFSFQLLKLEMERCEQDDGKADAVKEFRFGVYQYYE